jgi:transcriptional regulator with XRE-family HTH domain
MSDLRKRLSLYVSEKGFKQVKIAQKAGLTAHQFSDILREKRKMDADEFMLICAALDVNPTEIKNFASTG